MSDNAFLDLLRRGALGGGSGGESGGAGQGQDIANEKETPEIIFEGAKKVPGTVVKLAEGIPILGPLLSKLMPTNAGEVGIFAGLESQGITGKTINPMKGGTQGGALYNAIIAPLMKNSAITDHTGGTGSGGGGDFAASGGGSGGHTDFGDLGGSVGGGERFDWSPVAMASLGGLPRPITPDAGPGPEVGMSV